MHRSGCVLGLILGVAGGDGAGGSFAAIRRLAATQRAPSSSPH
ncbi:hypothetical protein [Allorhizocola rhizosphaerae]|nr:hypothetical protein [Allorhizocola rhizosphaerae]